jgi:molybdate transport system substrate-binding protein
MATLIGGRPARAEEVKVLSAVGMRQVMTALAAEFEKTSGHTLSLSFDSGAMIVRRLAGGETADVVLLPRAAAQELAGLGRALEGSVVDLASSRVGLAVRKGSPKPDISSPEALRRALLGAGSIACPDPRLGGSSGVHVAGVLKQLGIADAVASKMVVSSHPDREDEMPGRRVADGQADMALHQIQELMAVPGVEVVGPLPADLNQTFVFSAALVAGSPRGEAARALIAFLRTPRATAVVRSTGMEPPTR